MSNSKELSQLPTPPPDYDDAEPKDFYLHKLHEAEIVTTQPTSTVTPRTSRRREPEQVKECHELCDPYYSSKNCFTSLFCNVCCAPCAACCKILTTCCDNCCETHEEHRQRRAKNYTTGNDYSYDRNYAGNNESSGFGGIFSDDAGNNVWGHHGGGNDNRCGGWGHHGDGNDNRCDVGGGDDGGRCDSGGGDGGGCDSGGGGGCDSGGGGGCDSGGGGGCDSGGGGGDGGCD